MKVSLTDDEYRVRLADLPPGVKAMTCLSEDGFANVYVNARLNREQQWNAMLHELRHLMRDDAYNDLPIWQVEKSL